ncbi:MAG: hypothetical protein AB7G35_13655 [Hyphomicrobiaceae bacterium]
MKFIELTAARPVGDFAANGCKFLVPVNNIVTIASTPRGGCMVAFVTGTASDTIIKAETVETYDDVKKLLTPADEQLGAFGHNSMDPSIRDRLVEQQQELRSRHDRLNKKLKDQYQVSSGRQLSPRNIANRSRLLHEIRQVEGTMARIEKELDA